MELKCVTSNLNKLHGAESRTWLTRTLQDERPALVFGQELRAAEAQAIATSAGYGLITPQVVEPRWWMGSWVMVRNDLTYEPDRHERWSRFECYVAAGLRRAASLRFGAGDLDAREPQARVL